MYVLKKSTSRVNPLSHYEYDYEHKLVCSYCQNGMSRSSWYRILRDRSISVRQCGTRMRVWRKEVQYYTIILSHFDTLSFGWVYNWTMYILDSTLWPSWYGKFFFTSMSFQDFRSPHSLSYSCHVLSSVIFSLVISPLVDSFWKGKLCRNNLLLDFWPQRPMNNGLRLGFCCGCFDFFLRLSTSFFPYYLVIYPA